MPANRKSPVGGGHAGEQKIAIRAICWYQYPSRISCYQQITGSGTSQGAQRGTLLFAGMAASYS
jgi:hypothetical protein